MAWGSIKNIKDIVKDGAVVPLKRLIDGIRNYSAIQIGQLVLSPDTNDDVLVIEAGNNITITPRVDEDQSTGEETAVIRFDYSGSGGGTVVTSTVSGNTVTFTDASITANAEIRLFIKDSDIGYISKSINGTSITYTLEDNSANNKSAYIRVL